MATPRQMQQVQWIRVVQHSQWTQQGGSGFRSWNMWSADFLGDCKTSWWFQMFFNSPLFGEDEPIFWRAYFSDGLKPPTRKDMIDSRRRYHIEQERWYLDLQPKTDLFFWRSIPLTPKQGRFIPIKTGGPLPWVLGISSISEFLSDFYLYLGGSCRFSSGSCRFSNGSCRSSALIQPFSNIHTWGTRLIFSSRLHP